MAYHIVFDPNKCVACHACTIACIDQNDIDIKAGDKAYRNVYNMELEDAQGNIRCEYFSVACMHCADAPCINACPAECIQKDADTGMTVCDNTNCIGCRSCAVACPFGAPKFRKEDGKMVKCDGCYVRIAYGYKPACVAACAFGALSIENDEEFAADSSAKSVKNILDKLSQYNNTSVINRQRPNK